MAQGTPEATPSAEGTPVADHEQTNPYVFGNGFDLIPQGSTDEVEIVTQGPVVDSSVPVVIRNNTDDVIGLREVLGVARDQSGSLIGTVEVSSEAPYKLEPGGIAIADVYWSVDSIPPDANLDLEIEYETWGEDAYYQDLQIVEVTQTETGLIGIAENTSDHPVSGPFSVVGVCLDADGAIQGHYTGFADKYALEPGETTTFSATVYGTGPCDHYLVSAKGFAE
jgi:hypothetical protein